MSAEKLSALRRASGLSQRLFAKEMGVPLRTYENLEGGKSEVRLVHIYAARWAITRLISQDDLGVITPPKDVKDIIIDAAGNL